MTKHRGLDHSFDLYFLSSARRDALGALQRICAPDWVAILESEKDKEGESSFSLLLSLATDPVLAVWRAEHPEMHVGVPDGEVRVGMVDVWLKPRVAIPGLHEERDLLSVCL